MGRAEGGFHLGATRMPCREGPFSEAKRVPDTGLAVGNMPGTPVRLFPITVSVNPGRRGMPELARISRLQFRHDLP